MARVPPELFGRNISEIAALCEVDLSTVRKWKRGARVPPKSALFLIRGDLGHFDPVWSGWIVRRGLLISPEGLEITKNDVLAVPFERILMATLKAELRALKAEVSIQEQPTPENWPEMGTVIRA